MLAVLWTVSFSWFLIVSSFLMFSVTKLLETLSRSFWWDTQKVIMIIKKIDPTLTHLYILTVGFVILVHSGRVIINYLFKKLCSCSTSCQFATSECFTSWFNYYFVSPHLTLNIVHILIQRPIYVDQFVTNKNEGYPSEHIDFSTLFRIELLLGQLPDICKRKDEFGNWSQEKLWDKIKADIEIFFLFLRLVFIDEMKIVLLV